MQLLRTGDSGPAVAEVRSALREFGMLTPLAAGAPDDHYDSFVEGAVRAFQQQRGLITDGIVGPATYRALREARWTLGDRMLGLMISAPMAGDDVFALQERLLELGFDTGRPGGVFDAQTEKALRAFQREYGLIQDGICGGFGAAVSEWLTDSNTSNRNFMRFGTPDAFFKKSGEQEYAREMLGLSAHQIADKIIHALH